MWFVIIHLVQYEQILINYLAYSSYTWWYICFVIPILIQYDVFDVKFAVTSKLFDKSFLLFSTLYIPCRGKVNNPKINFTYNTQFIHTYKIIWINIYKIFKISCAMQLITSRFIWLLLFLFVLGIQAGKACPNYEVVWDQTGLLL